MSQVVGNTQRSQAGQRPHERVCPVQVWAFALSATPLLLAMGAPSTAPARIRCVGLWVSGVRAAGPARCRAPNLCHPDWTCAVDQMRRPHRLRWVRVEKLRPLQRGKSLQLAIYSLYSVGIPTAKSETRIRQRTIFHHIEPLGWRMQHILAENVRLGAGPRPVVAVRAEAVPGDRVIREGLRVAPDVRENVKVAARVDGQERAAEQNTQSDERAWSDDPASACSSRADSEHGIAHSSHLPPKMLPTESGSIAMGADQGPPGFPLKDARMANGREPTRKRVPLG